MKENWEHGMNFESIRGSYATKITIIMKYWLFPFFTKQVAVRIIKINRSNGTYITDQALQKCIYVHKASKVEEADQYYTAILKANPKPS